MGKIGRSFYRKKPKNNKNKPDQKPEPQKNQQVTTDVVNSDASQNIVTDESKKVVNTGIVENKIEKEVMPENEIQPENKASDKLEEVSAESKTHTTSEVKSQDTVTPVNKNDHPTPKDVSLNHTQKTDNEKTYIALYKHLSKIKDFEERIIIYANLTEEEREALKKLAMINKFAKHMVEKRKNAKKEVINVQPQPVNNVEPIKVTNFIQSKIQSESVSENDNTIEEKSNFSQEDSKSSNGKKIFQKMVEYLDNINKSKQENEARMSKPSVYTGKKVLNMAKRFENQCGTFETTPIKEDPKQYKEEVSKERELKNETTKCDNKVNHYIADSQVTEKDKDLPGNKVKVSEFINHKEEGNLKNSANNIDLVILKGKKEPITSKVIQKPNVINVKPFKKINNAEESVTNGEALITKPVISQQKDIPSNNKYKILFDQDSKKLEDKKIAIEKAKEEKNDIIENIHKLNDLDKILNNMSNKVEPKESYTPTIKKNVNIVCSNTDNKAVKENEKLNKTGKIQENQNDLVKKETVNSKPEEMQRVNIKNKSRRMTIFERLTIEAENSIDIPTNKNVIDDNSLKDQVKLHIKKFNKKDVINSEVKPVVEEKKKEEPKVIPEIKNNISEQKQKLPEEKPVKVGNEMKSEVKNTNIMTDSEINKEVKKEMKSEIKKEEDKKETEKKEENNPKIEEIKEKTDLKEENNLKIEPVKEKIDDKIVSELSINEDINDNSNTLVVYNNVEKEEERNIWDKLHDICVSIMSFVGCNSC